MNFSDVELTHEAEAETPPIWASFGDLMACLFGIFVLLFVWAIAFHVDLTRDLKVEHETRVAEEQKREKLEEMLKNALGPGGMEGRITMVDGRASIGGAMLFRSSSAELQPEGAVLLADLAKPLASYVVSHPNDSIMVSGFTDDLAVNPTKSFRDNWELSTARAMTVVRALIAAGVPADRVFGAGFGDTHPVAPNTNDEGRAKNRRVEIAPVPKR